MKNKIKKLRSRSKYEMSTNDMAAYFILTYSIKDIVKPLIIFSCYQNNLGTDHLSQPHTVNKGSLPGGPWAMA